MVAVIKRRRSLSVSNGGASIAKNRIIKAIVEDEVLEMSDKSEDSEELEQEEIDVEEENDDLSAEKIDEVPDKSHKKKRKTDDYQDIQIARETAELFKLNIFKMQIDELIKQVKLHETKIAVVEKFLHKLYGAVQDIDDVSDLDLDSANGLFSDSTKHQRFQKVSIPFADPKPININYKFGYKQPADITLVGSFGLKGGVQLPFNHVIDLNLEMPAGLFEKKDYLNYRAFHKRAFYLAYVTRALVDSIGVEMPFLKFHYEYVNNDLLTPSLRIDCVASDLDNEFNFFKSKFGVRIIASFPYGIFDVKKLVPGKNNIRIHLDTEELPATPVYNASLLTNTCYGHYLKILYKTKKQVAAFSDACTLGRLWLLQRGFKSGAMTHGGFGYFEFAMLTSALLKGGGVESNKILLTGFSSYQLFKGVVKYLATMDLCEQGSLSFHSVAKEAVLSHAKYAQDGYNVPTIFDRTTKLNLLWKMSVASYNMLRHEAKITLAMLNDGVKDHFDNIFLKNGNVANLKYDINLELPVPKYSLTDDQLVADDEGIVFSPADRITCISYENFIKNKIYTILETGLLLKVRQISVRIVDHSVSKYKQVSGTRTTIHRRKPELNLSTLKIHIGLILDQEESEKILIKGPSNADTEASEEFNLFWGNKVTVRRFKDSSINHCVVWENSSKEPVIIQIVKYLFSQHLDPFTASKIFSPASYLQEKIVLPLLPSASKTSAVNVNGFNNFKTNFETLQKLLLSLNDNLPLKIKTLMPSASAFRYSSLLVPVPFAVSSPDFFQEVVLEFESSKSWPDELTALENTKTAFLLKLYDLLQDSRASEDYQFFILADKQSIPYVDQISTLDVVTPEGYGFRIRVITERDEILYLRANSNVSKDKKPLLESIYLKFHRRYIGSVKQTRSVSTLAHHFLYYSPVVRLFKKWLDDQLLLCHLNDELVELLALRVFVDSEPWLPPAGVTNGFLRILYYLANWNWKEDSLILDLTKRLDKQLDSTSLEDGIDVTHETFAKLSDKLPAKTYQTIVSNFDRIRKVDPNGVKTQFFVGTKDDNSGILWSSNIPLPIATRLTALSRVAVNFIETQGLDKSAVDLLFKPALADYDIVIKTKSVSLSKSSGILTASSYKNLSGSFEVAGVDDVVEKFDPVVQFVNDLNDKYANIILFSTHKLGAVHKNGENVVTGIFYPNVLAKKQFKITLGYNIEPTNTEEFVALDKQAVYNEICSFGGDLIKLFKTRQS